MNSFGRLFSMTIFGESHGESVGLILMVVLQGLPIKTEDFMQILKEGKGGIQKGTTPRQESDLPIFKTAYSTTELPVHR